MLRGLGDELFTDPVYSLAERRRDVTGVASQAWRTLLAMSFAQPLPSSLSPSRLADFQACPRRYQHASIERVAQPATYATTKGRFVHYVFERLFALDGPERTIEQALGFFPSAVEAVVTEQVRADVAMDDTRLAQLEAESEAMVEKYFQMEDPRLIDHHGVELRLGATLGGAPLFGILDRLDRDEDGRLVIVDYKTGALPNRNYDSQTFANAELYAALCEGALGERPSAIRLLYVAHGTVIERGVTEIVVRARTATAAAAWERINRYYAAGEFPATPSRNACRFCSFQSICPVAVTVRTR